jgi:hypothetical protein
MQFIYQTRHQPGFPGIRVDAGFDIFRACLKIDESAAIT